jgi:hypothetical protein
MVKPDFRFRVKLREEILRTAIGAAAAELRPFDADAFRSRSLDYVSVEPNADAE